MTEQRFGPWIAHNATPDSTCPPDAVGKRVQVQTCEDRRLDAMQRDPRAADGWDWGDTGFQDPIIAYRILIEPVRGEVVFHGLIHGWTVAMLEADTHTLRLPTLDGALIPGEYTGPDGARIVVGVV